MAEKKVKEKNKFENYIWLLCRRRKTFPNVSIEERPGRKRRIQSRILMDRYGELHTILELKVWVSTRRFWQTIIRKWHQAINLHQESRCTDCRGHFSTPDLSGDDSGLLHRRLNIIEKYLAWKVDRKPIFVWWNKTQNDYLWECQNFDSLRCKLLFLNIIDWKNILAYIRTTNGFVLYW